METIQIALPESIQEFVRERISQGGYDNASEYLLELIQADQERKANDRLEVLLIEGLESGDPIPITPEYWQEKRRGLAQRLDQDQ